MKKVEEFKTLKYERDNYYFGIGFACWNVECKRRKFFVNAVYSDGVLMKNETTKDYTNGIKAFEILDDKYRLIKKIKNERKVPIVSLSEVEKYIISIC